MHACQGQPSLAAEYTVTPAGPTLSVQDAHRATAVREHPRAAWAVPGNYTVRPGDTLSEIASQAYGSTARWPALWWANRHQIPDPDAIVAGQRLRLSTWHPQRAWLARRALAAAAPTVVPAVTVSSQAPGPVTPGPSTAPAAALAPATSGGVNWGAVAACESGGNWGASTGNGFYGGLQFSEGTWAGYGGGQYAASANLASPAQQITVAQRVLAGQGIGAWPVCGANG